MGGRGPRGGAGRRADGDAVPRTRDSTQARLPPPDGGDTGDTAGHPAGSTPQRCPPPAAPQPPQSRSHCPATHRYPHSRNSCRRSADGPASGHRTHLPPEEGQRRRIVVPLIVGSLHSALQSRLIGVRHGVQHVVAQRHVVVAVLYQQQQHIIAAPAPPEPSSAAAFS